MALAPVGITFVSKGTGNLVRDLERIRQQLGLYGDTAEKVGNSARRSATGIRSMNRAITGTGSTVSRGQRSVASLSSSFSQLDSALSAPSQTLGALGTQIGRFGFRVTNIGRNLAQAGAGISAFVSLPIAGVLVGATKAALDYEKELIKLSTQIGLTGSEVKVFNDAILGIGQSSIAIETGVSAAELAGGAFTIASAGIRDADEALELLTQSAKAAQLGLGETADIGRAAAGAMQAFGVTGTEAVDILLATVREGNLVASDLAGTLGRYSGIAELLGVEFADAAAFIATFTRSGASAQEAATSLRGVLSTFAKPTKGTVDALAALKFPIEEVQQSIADPNIGLNATLLELAKRVEETGGDVGVGLAQIFGNVRALAGVAFVTGIPESLEEINIAIRESAGVVDQGFATIRQTAGFQIEQFKATVEVLGITIGNVLLPILSAAIQRILPFVEAIRAFVNENPRLIQVASVFALIAAAIGPLVIAMGTLILAVGAITAVIGGMISALGALISPIGLVVTAVLGLAAAIGGPLLLGFAEVSGFFDQSLSDIASNAFAWGRNIVVQFARGMIRGAIAVIDALNTIGQAITSWLRPGSPPRLLPDIDKWGTAAMNEFLHGFTLADFDTFDEVANLTEQVIRAGVKEITEGTVDSILSFRERIASAVASASAIDANFEGIAASIGFANAQLTAYTATMFRLQSVTEQVAAAQEQIDQINQNFERTVAPLNSELDAIEARRDEVRRAARTEELQSILADESAPALARELAQLELREFQILDQISAEEELRDEALTAAEAKLAALEAEQQALEEQAELQRRVIEAQLQQNDLLKEQKDAVERLADAVGRLGDSLGAIGGDGVGDIGFGDGILGDVEPFNFADLIGEGVSQATEEIISDFTEMKDELLSLLQPLIDKFLELKDTWAEVVEVFMTIGDDFADTRTTLDGVVQIGRDMAQEFIDRAPEYATSLQSIRESFAGTGEAIVESMSGITDVLFEDLNSEESVFGQIGVMLSSLAAGGLASFLDVWAFAIGFFLAPLRAVLESLPGILEGIIQVFSGWIGQFNALVAGDWSGFVAATGEVLTGVWNILLEIIRAFGTWFDIILGLFGTSLSEIGTTFGNWLVEQLIAVGNWTTDTQIAFFNWKNDVIATIAEWTTNTQIAFFNWKNDVIATIAEWTTDTQIAFFNWKNDVIETFALWVLGIITSIETWKTDATTLFTEFFDNIRETASGWVEDIVGILGNATALYEAGRNAMSGFKQGILSLAGELAEAAKSVVQGIINGVNNVLNNNSPSKVMIEIGKFAGRGLAIGLTDTKNLVARAAVDLASVIAPAAIQAQPVVSNSATVNMGGVQINNGMDEVMFESRVRRVLTQALGETL